MKFSLSIFSLILALFTFPLMNQNSCYAESGPPSLLNYQGNLTDDTGQPVSGDKNMLFRIYDSLSADPSSALWQSGLMSVRVESGRFSVVLGEDTPIPADIFSESDRYLGVTVEGAELIPRKRLVSVPYAMNCGIPSGAVIMWTGSVADIPPGWALCDGTNGTPDLTERFIIGASEKYPLGVPGGSATKDLRHTHTGPSHTHTGPSHTHTVSGTTSSGDYVTATYEGGDKTAQHTNHKHTFSVTSGAGGTGNTGASGTGNTGSGGSATQDIIPPYYALLFIMKL